MGVFQNRTAYARSVPMANVLMNLLSAFLILHPAQECAPQAAPAVIPPTSEYMVVERLDGDVARLESDRGSFEIPAQMLPIGAREGTVIEWRTDAQETQRRLASAQDRLRRMRNHDALEI